MKFSRRSGILLHPTSLSGPFGCGDFGKDAYRFVDWLAASGQSLWQMLPLGPIGAANSPYSSLSSYAGNPLLVNLQDLADHGWLLKKDLALPPLSNERVDFPSVVRVRNSKLRKAGRNFFASKGEKRAFHRFCESEASWLNNFALFMALHEKFSSGLWCEWEPKFSQIDRATTQRINKHLAAEIGLHKFVQWRFYEQWASLKEYARKKNISLIGDIPIYVAHDSADVWANPHQYFLDEHGYPTVVAGVPPDYFSKTGQHWGNPLYRWDLMRMDGYAWWKRRLTRTFKMFDIVRIDHFRGFAGYWEIPATESTGERGRWMPGPGQDFFDAMQVALDNLPVIAEDLGVITTDVVALRDRYGFPGMKILQFAFNDGMEHPFLPHNYIENCVVYTGTHDNDTTRSWFQSASEWERKFTLEYLKTKGEEIHWELIAIGSESKADTFVAPLQDVLGLGGEARMNFPGKVVGNWQWRFSWDMMRDEFGLRLKDLTARNRRS